jgi:TP901-1 family phage major tail protein
MAIYNGTAQLIKIGASGSEEALAQLTNCTMSMNQDLFDTTSKESGAWKSVMPGVRDVTYSGEGLADFTETGKYNLTDLWTAYNAQSQLRVQFTNGTSVFTQQAYISSMEVTAPMEDVATYTVELTGTGAVTFA